MNRRGFFASLLGLPLAACATPTIQYPVARVASFTLYVGDFVNVHIRGSKHKAVIVGIEVVLNAPGYAEISCVTADGLQTVFYADITRN